jgi:hypothetical protein
MLLLLAEVLDSQLLLVLRQLQVQLAGVMVTHLLTPPQVMATVVPMAMMLLLLMVLRALPPPPPLLLSCLQLRVPLLLLLLPACAYSQPRPCCRQGAPVPKGLARQRQLQHQLAARLRQLLHAWSTLAAAQSAACQLNLQGQLQHQFPARLLQLLHHWRQLLHAWPILAAARSAACQLASECHQQLLTQKH